MPTPKQAKGDRSLPKLTRDHDECHKSDPVDRRSNRVPIIRISVCTDDGKRWSDVVPPNSGLTFAVLWDPEQDIVTFSDADLLDSVLEDQGIRRKADPDSPTDATSETVDLTDDGVSQVLTIKDSLKVQTTATTPAGTLAFLCDYYGDFFSSDASPPDLSLPKVSGGHDRASSTLNGLDVYLRASVFGSIWMGNDGRSKKYSFLDKFANMEEFKFDPRTSFAKWWVGQVLDREESRPRDSAICDSGYVESVLRGPDGMLSSAFSTTTTSTSKYVTVNHEDCRDDDTSSSEDSAWSTLEPPNTPVFPSCNRHHHRRLTKRRPNRINDRDRNTLFQLDPVPPTQVLDRTRYNFSTVDSHDTRTEATHDTNHSITDGSIHRFLRSLATRSWRRSKH